VSVYSRSFCTFFRTGGIGQTWVDIYTTDKLY
jgi:hypothetical protein